MANGEFVDRLFPLFSRLNSARC